MTENHGGGENIISGGEKKFVVKSVGDRHKFVVIFVFVREEVDVRHRCRALKG